VFTSSQNVSAVGNNSLNRPYAGIIGLSLTADMSKKLRLNQTKGFLVTSITKGSPAENPIYMQEQLQRRIMEL